MWKRLKSIVRRPLQGLLGAHCPNEPSRWARAEQALRRAQQTREKQRAAGRSLAP